MELHCTTCATRFVVPDSAIGINGRKVKCANCGAVWRQFPDGRMEHPAPAAAAAPAPMAAPEPRLPEPPAPEPVRSAKAEMPDPLAEFDLADHDHGVDHEEGSAEKPSFSSLMIEDLPDPLESGPLDRDPLEESSSSHDIDDLLGSDNDLGDLFTDRKPAPVVPAKKGRGALGAILSFVVVLLVVIGGLYGLRNMIVERYPDTLAVYDLIGVPVDVLGAGLRFDAEGTVGEMLVVNGVPTLVVRGTYTNTSSRPRQVPAIRLVVVDATDTVLQDAFVAPLQPTLAPHAKQGFHLKIDNVAAAAVRWKWFWAKMPAAGQTGDNASMTSAAPAPTAQAPAAQAPAPQTPGPAMTASPAMAPATPKPLTVPDPVPAKPATPATPAPAPASSSSAAKP